MLEATIKFFDIKRCGYYLRGDGEPSLGSIEDTLKKLSDWASDGREIINTTCYEPDIDNDQKNTYFSGWRRDNTTGDSLLVLWNEVDNDNGVIYGVSPTEQPGNIEMLETSFGDTPAIPGFPSYFWFIPSRNVFATIRFTHSVQRKGNLDLFLNGFLANKSPYRVLDVDGTVIGFSTNARATDTSAKLLSKFYAIGRKQEELEAELLANRHKIRRIIKRENLRYHTEEDRGLIERIFSQLLNNAPVFGEQVRLITHELQFEPTEQQLRQILTNFSELDTQTSIRNAGFIYNDGKRIMLKGASVSFSTELSVIRNDNQIIAPDVLLSALTRQRQELMRPLDEATFEVEQGETND